MVFNTANAKLSGSSTSTGSFGQGFIADKLGIGTTSPADSLTVVGSVSASESGSFRDLVNTGDMFSTHLTGSFSGSFHGEIGARFIFTKVTAATTWNIQHNFGTKYPNVTVYDSNDAMVIPTSVIATDSKNMTLTFSSAVAGIAMLGLGGMSNNVTGRTFVHTNSSSEIWRVTHSLGEKFPAVTIYDETDNVIIPDNILAVNASNMEVTFQNATSGNAHFSVGNGLPGISSANAGKFMKVNGAGTHITYETPAFDATGSLGVTGSIEIFGSGSISGSSVGTGSFGHLIIAGNISASGVVRADSFESAPDGDSINFADSVDIVGSITASGVISAVGGITGSSTSTGSFGSLQIDGKIGVGTASNLKSQLHIYRDDSITHTPSQTAGQKGLLIEQDGTGDAVMEFLTTGVTNYVMGIDNSDSDAFKITKGQFRLGDGSVHFRYGPTGILTLEGTSARLGIGTDNTQANLHVVGSGLITTNLEVQGNTSGSSTSTGSFGHATIADTANVIGRLGIGTTNTSPRKLLVLGTDTTNAVAYIYSNAVHTGTDSNSILAVRSDNTSANGSVMNIHNDGSGASLTLNGEGKVMVSGSSTSTGSFAHGFIANNLGIGKTPLMGLDIEGAGNDGRIMIKQTTCS